MYTVKKTRLTSEPLENIVSEGKIGYMTIEEFRKWGHELVDEKFRTMEKQ